MIDDEQAFLICQRNGIQLTKGPRLTREVAEALLRMEEEIEEQKGNYLRCCQTVAAMHEAAMGEVCGPRRGVVEDVEDLRKERDALRAEIAKALRAEMARWVLGAKKGE